MTISVSTLILVIFVWFVFRKPIKTATKIADATLPSILVNSAVGLQKTVSTNVLELKAELAERNKEAAEKLRQLGDDYDPDKLLKQLEDGTFFKP